MFFIHKYANYDDCFADNLGCNFSYDLLQSLMYLVPTFSVCLLNDGKMVMIFI